MTDANDRPVTDAESESRAAAKPTVSSASLTAKPETFLAGNGLGSRIFYRFGWSVSTGLSKVYTRLTINGREHLPKEGPFVLAPLCGMPVSSGC